MSTAPSVGLPIIPREGYLFIELAVAVFAGILGVVGSIIVSFKKDFARAETAKTLFLCLSVFGALGYVGGLGTIALLPPVPSRPQPHVPAFGYLNGSVNVNSSYSFVLANRGYSAYNIEMFCETYNSTSSTSIPPLAAYNSITPAGFSSGGAIPTYASISLSSNQTIQIRNWPCYKSNGQPADKLTTGQEFSAVVFVSYTLNNTPPSNSNPVGFSNGGVGIVFNQDRLPRFTIDNKTIDTHGNYSAVFGDTAAPVYNFELACETYIQLYGIPNVSAAMYNSVTPAGLPSGGIINKTTGISIRNGQPTHIRNWPCYQTNGQRISNLSLGQDYNAIVVLRFTLNNTLPSTLNPRFHTTTGAYGKVSQG